MKVSRNLLFGLLALSLPLGEAYNIFHVPYLDERAWFILSDLRQDIEWYIKDGSEGLIWIIFLWVWYIREKRRDRFWKWLILLFLIFRVVDFCCYWLNHRHAGPIYGLCYLSIGIYGCYGAFREYKKNKL